MMHALLFSFNEGGKSCHRMADNQMGITMMGQPIGSGAGLVRHG
jgi:hypothetical protein